MSLQQNHKLPHCQSTCLSITETLYRHVLKWDCLDYHCFCFRLILILMSNNSNTLKRTFWQITSFRNSVYLKLSVSLDITVWSNTLKRMLKLWTVKTFQEIWEGFLYKLNIIFSIPYKGIILGTVKLVHLLLSVSVYVQNFLSMQ